MTETIYVIQVRCSDGSWADTTPSLPQEDWGEIKNRLTYLRRYRLRKARVVARVTTITDIVLEDI